MKNSDNLLIPFNHMIFASVSYSGGRLKIFIDYEKGNYYNFKKDIKL